MTVVYSPVAAHVCRPGDAGSVVMYNRASCRTSVDRKVPTESANAFPRVDEEHEAAVSTRAQPQRRLGDEPGVARGQLQRLLQRGANVGHAAHVPALPRNMQPVKFFLKNKSNGDKS